MIYWPVKVINQVFFCFVFFDVLNESPEKPKDDTLRSLHSYVNSIPIAIGLFSSLV